MLVKAVSYNVHRCIGIDGRHDIDRICKVIRLINADIVALQEVDHSHDEEHASSALRKMAIDSGYKFFEQVNFRRSVNNVELGYGNALLFKGEVSQVKYHNLSVARYEPRGALELEGVIAGNSLRIINTHIGLRRRERNFQFNNLENIISSGIGPDNVLLMGDFNEWLAFGRWRGLRRLFGHQPRYATWPSLFPVFSLDHIWVRPLNFLKKVYICKHPLARVASDHLPVIAEISLPGFNEFISSQSNDAAILGANNEGVIT